MLGSFEYSSDIVGAAATLADHGSLLSLSPPSTIQARCQDYWLASHDRCQKWNTALRIHEAPYTLMAQDEQHSQWLLLHGLFEEIVAAGILARVWTAIASSFTAEHDIESFLQSVYVGQLETRRRALKLILKETVNYWQSAELDKLRRRAERWTDLLLAHVVPTCPVEKYAFELPRVEDFAETLAARDQRSVASPLLLQSLKRPIGQNVQVKCPHPELNRRVTESILAVLGPDTCDSTGKHSNLWKVRLACTVEDTQQLVEQLSLENESPHPN